MNTRTRFGCHRKLVSINGTLLGHVSIPQWANIILNEHDVVRFQGYQRPVTQWDGTPVPDDLITSIGTLASWSFDFPGGVQLFGISLEELEKTPGFAFYPSAAYLRSIIE